MPCTTLLVGKLASYDGSTIVARNEDAKFCPKKFRVVPPEEQPGHYKSVISHVEIDLPADPMRYTCIPNALPDQGIWGAAGVNEANVSMSATETITTNERVLGADPLVKLQEAKGTEGDPNYVPEVVGGIGEEDLVTLVLPYIHTAREGVLRLGELLQTYGTYELNGIAFSDVDEIWWLETIGGHHWMAKRVPDDAYAAIPNQLGIDSFDLDDAFGAQHDDLCSADLREFMADNHLDLTLRAEGDSTAVFNPREAFGSHSDGDHVYNTPRAWSMQRFLNPHAEAWDDPNCPLGPESEDIPWARVPERKLTMEDVKYVLSLHFQSTPYDPYERHGNAELRGKYRPIGISRTGHLSAVQLRPYAPEATRAVQWIAYSSNPFNALVPFFANVSAVPDYVGNTTERVTTDSFYWENRIIGALADAHFGPCSMHIERYQQAVGARGHELIHKADEKVREQGLSYEAATPLLTEANDEIADMLRTETDDVLGKVLEAASEGMKNGFSRTDG